MNFQEKLALDVKINQLTNKVNYLLSISKKTTKNGIEADFFADFFDRNDSGKLNGYWVGRVGYFAITDGALKAINTHQTSVNIVNSVSRFKWLYYKRYCTTVYCGVWK